MKARSDQKHRVKAKNLSPPPQYYKFVAPRIKRSCADCSVFFRKHLLGQKAIVLVNWTRYNFLIRVGMTLEGGSGCTEWVF